MRAAADGSHRRRLGGLIVVLWRAGLRIHEALAVGEADLDHRRGSLLVQHGKGGRRREVGMDESPDQLHDAHAVRWLTQLAGVLPQGGEVHPDA
jgi:site-specific recombinase XerD